MTPELAESVTGCLDTDHRHLDAALLESETAARAGRFAEARTHFAAFASGLIRHIEAEEGELFPELEEIQPSARGPTSVMRGEHQEMRAMLERIGRELMASEPGWEKSMRRLNELLVTHNTKEERVLYPMADAAAQRTARTAALGERLRRTLGAQPSVPA